MKHWAFLILRQIFMKTQFILTVSDRYYPDHEEKFLYQTFLTITEKHRLSILQHNHVPTFEVHFLSNVLARHSNVSTPFECRFSTTSDINTTFDIHCLNVLPARHEINCHFSEYSYSLSNNRQNI